MCLTTFCVKPKLHLKKLQLMVFQIIMLHENTDILPFVYSYDLYPGNNYPTEVIMIVLVGIHAINKLGWKEVANKD